MAKVKFKIDGMHCTSCAMSIDMDLEDLDGVKSSNTSYAKQLTEVEFDEERVDARRLQEAIEKSGYKASVLD